MVSLRKLGGLFLPIKITYWIVFLYAGEWASGQHSLHEMSYLLTC